MPVLSWMISCRRISIVNRLNVLTHSATSSLLTMLLPLERGEAAKGEEEAESSCAWVWRCEDPSGATKLTCIPSVACRRDSDEDSLRVALVLARLLGDSAIAAGGAAAATTCSACCCASVCGDPEGELVTTCSPLVCSG